MSKSNPHEGCTHISIAERRITFTEEMPQQLLSEFSGAMEAGALFDLNRRVAEDLGQYYESLPTASLRNEVQVMRKAIDGMAESVWSNNEEKAKTAQSFIDEANAAWISFWAGSVILSNDFCCDGFTDRVARGHYTRTGSFWSGFAW
jgi:hypothetical protein